jgi:hypothetical protein
VTEAGRSAHQFTEVASRARGNFTDVRMALIEMGKRCQTVSTGR